VSFRAVALSGALAAFALALLSKESAVALPGVVVLRLAFAPGEARLWRAIRVGSAYAGVLAAFLAWRFIVLGEVGGYGHPLQRWEVIFPSAPLRQLGIFLFPVNRGLLLEAGGPVCVAALVVLMSGGALWWARRAVAVPADRLWFYVGYLVIMSVPVWTLSTGITRDLEGTRLVYLPTIGLAWLFGDLCRGARPCGRAAALLSMVTIIVAGTLTACYVTPWRRADRVATRVLAAGRDLAEALPPTDSNLVLFVQGLPEDTLGAQVFRNGFDAALRGVVHRPVVVHTVGSGGSSEALPEVLRSSDLLPGEYEVVWRNDAGALEILRAGGAPRRPSIAEGIP
jgi:hypothetical protein